MGCEVASKTYFGKSVKDLDLAECALLAGIIRSPEYYSPYHDMEAALSWCGDPLALMVDQDTSAMKSELPPTQNRWSLLTAEERCLLLRKHVIVTSTRTRKSPEYLSRRLPGLITLDLDMQEAAEKRSPGHAGRTEGLSRITQPQGALVAIEPETGTSKPWSGRSWNETRNRATRVKRQPGSAFKIILYTAADQKHPVTETKCEPWITPGLDRTAYKPVDYGRTPYHYALNHAYCGGYF